MAMDNLQSFLDAVDGWLEAERAANAEARRHTADCLAVDGEVLAIGDDAPESATCREARQTAVAAAEHLAESLAAAAGPPGALAVSSSLRPWMVRVSAEFDVEAIFEHDPANYPDGPAAPDVQPDSPDAEYWTVLVWAATAEEAADEAIDAVPP